MKTRTPDLLGMSYACANMVHCPGYADDLRQYATLNRYLAQLLIGLRKSKAHIQIQMSNNHPKEFQAFI